MNVDVGRAWVDALRSGRYRQGRGRLTQVLPDEDGEPTSFHCCLGVLCELAVEAGVAVRADQRYAPSDRLTTTYRDAHDGDDPLGEYGGYPPTAVWRWAGLPDENPLLGDARASYLNDHRQVSFGAIADRIERYLLEHEGDDA